MTNISHAIAYGDYDQDPSKYVLEDANPLKRAVGLAIQLGRPLLITGEPGTGKTQLAHWAAWYLEQQKQDDFAPFVGKPFIFNTKTTSTGKDLFYLYDAISHFQDKSGKKDVREFISLTEVGQAILQTWGRDYGIQTFRLRGVKNTKDLDAQPRSVVVLIDEVDKAPKDFTNDLLNEIENKKFYIPEIDTNVGYNKEPSVRSLVIITSNNEKSLPEAFLRRCLFYNITFPSDKELISILTERISPFLEKINQKNGIDLGPTYLRALKVFAKARQKSTIKPPATSELIDWVKVLHLENLLRPDLDLSDLTALDDEQKKALQLSLFTLFKTREDLLKLEDLYK